MNRCKYCNVVCPDFSDVCDCCAYIEQEEILDEEIEYKDEEFENE